VAGVLRRLEAGKAEVEIHGKRLLVAASSLVKLGGMTKPKFEVGVSARTREGAPSELNLIGCTVEEGTARCDRFLEDAVLARLPQVRIIHGHGTNKLKNKLREHLKAHPHVAAHEASEEGGATLVTLDL